MGSDTRGATGACSSTNFNPRSPDGERPVTAIDAIIDGLFQSTLPGWGATAKTTCSAFQKWHFNPRSPDGERRQMFAACSILSAFQSTLPGWGATGGYPVGQSHHQDFNPRSPDGERRGLPPTVDERWLISIHAPRMGSDISAADAFGNPDISIHAPRMGSDRGDAKHDGGQCEFQSTLPGWGATHHRHAVRSVRQISIHAPRMGSDASFTIASTPRN